MVVLTGIYATKRMTRDTVLAFITTAFFLLSYSYSCDFKTLDPERMYRYLFWVGLDTLYVAILFGFWFFDKIKNLQFVLIGFLEVISFLIQAARLVDAHYNNYTFTDNFYAEAMNAYNILIIFVVGLSLINAIFERIKDFINGRSNHSNDDNDLFSARSWIGFFRN